MSLESGQVIEGKYRIIRLLGEGGMGAVYEGENVRIHRKVAIKVLHAAFTENQEVVQRFEREAQAAGHIGNDHIMEVLDLGQLENGDLFLVMEYLDGEALSDRVRRLGRMNPDQIVPLMLEVLEGLAAAHGAGIIHRDLKPDNIFILKEKAGQKDFVKIIDFGISKFQPMSGDGMKMTKTGTMMGTPYYMSPEQATGSREADARSDIYALGVIVYECVTGTVPFDAPSFNQLLFKIALTTPPPLEQVRPDIDAGFCSVVAKAMAREVEERFASCQAFADALGAWSRDRTGVSVPPPVSEAALQAEVRERASVVAIPPGVVAVPSAGGVPGGAATSGNWSSSQAEAPGRSGAVMAGLAAVALVALGGGGLAVYKALGSEDAPAAASAAAPEAPNLVKVADERRKQEEAAAKQAQEQVAAEKKAAEEKAAEEKAAEEKAAEEKAAEEKAAEEKAAEEKAAAKVARPAAPRPRTVHAPAPAPAPAPVAKPAPAPKPAAGGGDLDFGY